MNLTTVSKGDKDGNGVNVTVSTGAPLLLVHLSILAEEEKETLSVIPPTPNPVEGDGSAGQLLPVTKTKRNFWVQLGRWIKYEEKVEQDAQRLGNAQIPIVTYDAMQKLRHLFSKSGQLLTIDGQQSSSSAECMDLIVESLCNSSTLSITSKSEKSEFIEKVLLANHVLKLKRHGSVSRKRKGSNPITTASNGSLNNFGDGLIRTLRRGSIMIGLTSQQQDEGITGTPDKDRKSSLSQVYKYTSGGPGGGIGLAPSVKGQQQTQFIGNFRRGSLPFKPRASIISMENMKWMESSEAKSGTVALDGKSEISLVLIGENGNVQKEALLFVQFSEPIMMPELTEVRIPVRFICLVLMPPNSMHIIRQKELGRSIATLFANQEFQAKMRKTKSKQQILQGIDQFLENCIIIPPGKWDPERFPFDRLKSLFKSTKPVAPVKIQQQAQVQDKISITDSICELAEWKESATFATDAFDKDSDQASLHRTGKCFGGLRAEFWKRFPLYFSDLKDGLNIQCLATIIFVYFACVSGNIAFGGLMGTKTDNYIGISEVLMSAAVGGVIYSIFSAQPLLIVGTTGPVLVFDESLFQLCSSYKLSGEEFLAVRVWIGIWLALIALIFTSFDGTYLLKYFTRFTQEIFSTLISFLFIVESIRSLLKIYKQHPILEFYEYQSNGTTGIGIVSDTGQPNVALLSTILMFGTYFIATTLKDFRNSGFFNSTFRNVIANFAVLFSLILMGLLDWYISQTNTPKLNLPDASEGLKNSHENRTSWFINPFKSFDSNSVQFWTIPLLTCIPAVLLYIFIFMETGIAELIVDKKESKLRKGSGFHLDILLMCLINTLMGLFGLGWVSAPPIRSIAHLNALTLYSSGNIPGEKPLTVGALEQRLTGFFISFLTGISVLMADILIFVPLAVLFGIFLFMGVTSLDGVQFYDRTLLLFKPIELHPQVPYVSNVRRKRMNIFTIIQLFALGILWTIKESPAGLFLALLTIVLVPFRFFILRLWFSEKELNALDAP